MSKVTNCEIISETNDHATRAKLNAVSLGYFEDEFITKMFPIPKERNAPEINRGYAVRVIVLRNVIKNFVTQYKYCQIVSCGAGYDTLFLYLRKLNLAQSVGLFEVDYQSVIAHKSRLFRKHYGIDFQQTCTGFTYQGYKIIAADLNDIPSLEAGLKSQGFRNNIPTLILCECVLIYLEDDKIEALIKFFADNTASTESIMINYDPMNLDDKFGTVMKKNLKEQNYELLGRKICSNLNTHVNISLKVIKIYTKSLEWIGFSFHA